MRYTQLLLMVLPRKSISMKCISYPISLFIEIYTAEIESFLNRNEMSQLTQNLKV